MRMIISGQAGLAVVLTDPPVGYRLGNTAPLEDVDTITRSLDACDDVALTEFASIDEALAAVEALSAQARRKLLATARSRRLDATIVGDQPDLSAPKLSTKAQKSGKKLSPNGVRGAGFLKISKKRDAAIARSGTNGKAKRARNKRRSSASYSPLFARASIRRQSESVADSHTHETC